MTKFICTCLFRESLTMPFFQYPGEKVKNLVNNGNSSPAYF